MLKCLSRKLIVGAAALVLAAGAFGTRANAQTGIEFDTDPPTFEPSSFAVIVDVAPGTRQCITSYTQAYNNAAADDYVLSGPPVTFTFGSVGSFLSGSGGPVYYYYRMFVRTGVTSFFGPKFPAYYRTCARNDGTEYATVYLSLAIDQ